MTRLSTHSRAENARKASTPWRTDRTKRPARRKARREMSVLELECRITPEQYEQIHAEQRARVRARFGPVARASADVPIRVEDFETPGADTDEVPF